MGCKFFEDGINAKLKNKRGLSKFIAVNILQETNLPAQLQYIFVTDSALIEMNNHFLQHNTYTDIITFNLSENNKKIIGEIYISVERVVENALKFNTTYHEELHRVIFHGALHLCGYKDKVKKDVRVMRAREDKWLAAYLKM
jgi:probable rRNA maturation factor